jgi:hypothetical protein
MAAYSGYRDWKALRNKIRMHIEAELRFDVFGMLIDTPNGEFDVHTLALFDLLHANGYFAEKPDSWDVLEFLSDLSMEGQSGLLLLLGCVAIARDIELANHGSLAELAVDAWGDVMNYGAARIARRDVAAERLSHFYAETGRTIVDFYLRRPAFPERNETGLSQFAAVFASACVAGDPGSAETIVQRFANMSLSVELPPDQFDSLVEDCLLAVESTEPSSAADARTRYSRILLQLAAVQPTGLHGAGVEAVPYVGACAFTDEHGVEHSSTSLLALAVRINAKYAISALVSRRDMSAEHVTEALELDETLEESAEMLTLLQAGKARLRGEVETRERILLAGPKDPSGRPPRSPSPDMGF